MESVAPAPARKRRRPWLILAAVLTLAGLLMVTDLVATWFIHAPLITALATRNPEQSSYMRGAARTGHPVRNWRWTPLDSIAPIAACAVIRSEDGEFFNVGTLNYGIQRDLLRRLLRGDFSRGGSGIAQQLARNLFLGPQRTPRRKAREYLLAYQVSNTLSKARQLELYLNLVEWGEGVWGIGAASRHYFGVPPSRLTASESIILAVLLPAPRLGVRYAIADRSARKMPDIARGLAQAMLLDDLARAATVERLALWRTAVANGANAAAAAAAADSIMGPEPSPRALSGTDRRPLAWACNARRRPR
jgi:monofunctional biosynthetic peptidoglycan transglycosylase